MRGWLKSGLIPLIALAAVVAAPPSADAQELKLGSVPVLGESETRAEFEPLCVYLSTIIGRRVSVHIAKDEGDLRAQMEAGAVDIGSFSPLAYVQAARGGKIRIIARSVLSGSTGFRAVIIKRFDSGIASLTDLEGKRFAFVDSKSESGYLLPRAVLAERGIRPERFFKETIFTGSHEKVISAVLLGAVHAGATDEDAVAAAKARGLPTFDLEVLARTEPIPHDAIAVRVGLDDGLVKRVQTALVEMGRSAAGREVMARSTRKLTGHVSADDMLFEGVRRLEKMGGL